MTEFKYDSYCGIYCGACDIHIGYKTGKTDRLALFWTESLLKTVQKAQGNTGLTSESLRIRCNGCKSDTLFINCRTCAIRSCAIDRKFEHCNECKEYPCAHHLGMRKLGGVLPHVKNNQGNLETIQKVGVGEWLEQQKKRWACPECNTSFAWYSPACSTCGKKLKGLSYRFTLFSAFLLKLGIRLASLRKPRR